MDLKDFDLTQLFFQLLAIAAAVITVYGVLTETGQKTLIVAFGAILILVYIRWYLSDTLIKNLKLQNNKIKIIENKFNSIKEEISFIRGWMNAKNHLKNKRGAIDPILLIIIIIIVIILILYSQGKL